MTNYRLFIDGIQLEGQGMMTIYPSGEIDVTDQRGLARYRTYQLSPSPDGKHIDISVQSGDLVPEWRQAAIGPKEYK